MGAIAICGQAFMAACNRQNCASRYEHKPMDLCLINIIPMADVISQSVNNQIKIENGPVAGIGAREPITLL